MPELPPGLVYREGFLTPAEEQALIAQIEALPLREARYRSFTAKRRILSFGAGYDFETNVLLQAPALPPFLLALREQIAAWADVPARELAQSTVAEYAPGNAARLAPRRSSLRNRRRHLAGVAVPDAAPAVSAREAWEGARACAGAGATLGVHPAGRRQVAVAARDLADQGAPLLDHFSDDEGK
jgi:hypothetical protein